MVHATLFLNELLNSVGPHNGPHQVAFVRAGVLLLHSLLPPAGTHGKHSDLNQTRFVVVKAEVRSPCARSVKMWVMEILA